MSEHRRVMCSLEDAGVPASVSWAYKSAVDRTLDMYSEPDGLGRTWLGVTKYTLFCDRLDRVFACGRYGLQPGVDTRTSLDVLHAELSQQEIAAMPDVSVGRVVRGDLNGSPGWIWDNQRFLLASCAFGQLDELPWPQKSPTKQRVATQPSADWSQPNLFADVLDQEFAGLLALISQPQMLDLETFVVGHTLDPVSELIELVFGRARHNSGGGRAWHWSQNLLSESAPDGGRRIDTGTERVRLDVEPDAEVRLRRKAVEQPRGLAKEVRSV